MLLEFLNRIFFFVPKLPRTAQIAVTNRCNFNCAMCQRFDLKVELKDFEFDKFKIIIEKLKGINDIILTGWGEPLIHPDLIEMIRLCREKGWHVRFTTNGELLTPEIMDKLIANDLTAITFSIDQITETGGNLGHRASIQVDNIIELKRKIVGNNSPMKIYLQSVYQKGKEKDILDVVDFAVSKKIDKVRLSRLDVRFKNIPRPNFAEEKQLIREIEEKIKGSNVELDFLPHVAFSGWRKIVYKLTYKLLHRFGRYCLRTFQDIYINENAEVTPCCALPNLSMGNLLENDLLTIWQGEKFKRFRIEQSKFCGKCDVLKLRIDVASK